MARSGPLVALWVLVATAAVAGSQSTRPDFSGEWVLETTSAPGADVVHTMIVQQSVEPPHTRLRIERHSTGAPRVKEYPIGLAGGVVAGVTLAQPPDPMALVNNSYSYGWFGDQLVFEESRHAGRGRGDGAYESHREVWTLAAPNRLQITITDEGSDTTPVVVKLVYRRR